ncbi:MAG TPA: flagellar hook protein FlgE [Symbiobacteriaceae bacterium]|nr:flagellar hook protein FlgE [Symbiobacteriaceae bacterium]
MRALYSGVTGIRSHQVRMDVIGNNIANVNTVGFKGSRVTFQDVFSQTMSAGSASTSPQQVGLGAGVASTDLNGAAGSFQLTGRDLDLAIEGAGLFVLKSPGDGQRVYTRVGNFDWDAQGYMVNPATGQRVQGWMADSDGTVSNTGIASLGDIQLIRGDVSLAQLTTSAAFGGNLDSGADDGDTYQTTFTAYDSLGNPVPIVLTFEKTGTNDWSWEAEGPAAAGVTGSGDLTFNPDGTILTGGTNIQVNIASPPGGDDAQAVALDFTRITQAYAGTQGSSVLARTVDGYPMGVLESISVEQSGQITGVFSNGFRRTLAQVAVASFSNPNGLLKEGNTAFVESANSGAPQIGTPTTGGRGRLVPGNLEMSNVDLSTEFTNMITTQRGFQANTRIITAADEMLQDVVNLRR